MGHDVVHHLGNALLRVEHLSRVDGFHVDVHERPRGVAVSADVLYTERQHLLVTDGVRDDVLVQAVPKEVTCCSLAQVVLGGILREDGRAREPKELVVGEKLRNALVRLPKLASVALVEDEDHLL